MLGASKFITGSWISRFPHFNFVVGARSHLRVRALEHLQNTLYIFSLCVITCSYVQSGPKKNRCRSVIRTFFTLLMVKTKILNSVFNINININILDDQTISQLIPCLQLRVGIINREPNRNNRNRKIGFMFSSKKHGTKITKKVQLLLSVN